MNFKKMLAAAAAITACLSAVAPAAAFAEDATEPSTQSLSAYLDFVDGGWWIKHENGDEDNLTGTFAEITGDGTYTVSVSKDSSKLADDVTTGGVQFAAIMIPDGETVFPDMVITVDSIKADDTEIPMTAKNYTSSDDEVVTRTNLYNQWVNKIPDDARSTEGKLSELEDTSAYSYKVINPEDISDWDTLTVEFTVTGTGIEAPAPKEESKYVGTSYLDFVDGGWWIKHEKGDEDNLIGTYTDITGNGSYSVSVSKDSTKLADDVTTGGVQFAAIMVPGAEAEYPEMVITVDSIVADDTEIPLIAKNYTSSDDGEVTRTNIYNQWVSKLPDDARSTEGVLSELDDTSAYSYMIVNPDDISDWDTLTVNFTVSGLNFDKAPEEEQPTETETETEKATEAEETESSSSSSTTTSTTKSTTATTKATTTTAKSTTTSGSTESPKTGDVNVPAVAGAVAAAAMASLLIAKKKND
ncbi:MAG: hypothetical protein IJJ69_13675 [Oscillospiraceae bacterium]|nr:hypothetical protein [Oscillospiraceae bacterium]